jgi:transcriptional regulator with XRE-family HTH domain
MPNNIPFRIRQRRKELGLSQDALAKACGVGQSTVANWERGGHIPRQATLHKISRALNTTDAWILSGETSKRARSLMHYLSRPIRHIAIYDWPTNARDFEAAQPIGYMPLATQDEGVFAYLLKDDRTPFIAGTTLVFSQDFNQTSQGFFLDISDDNIKLTQGPSNGSQARLIYSLTPY